MTSAPCEGTLPGKSPKGYLGMFVDEHDRFRVTRRTAAAAARLNLRHEAMIAANRDILTGARVLDLASHDGRWS